MKRQLRGVVVRYGRRYECDAVSGTIGGDSRTVINLKDAPRAQWEDVVMRPRRLVPTVDDFPG